jgi:hypothetical protein
METAGITPNTADETGDHVDRCVCDIELRNGEATPDADLPTAAGGVESIQSQTADPDAIDGCDIDFKEFSSTLDEDLPISVGGVG